MRLTFSILCVVVLFLVSCKPTQLYQQVQEDDVYRFLNFYIKNNSKEGEFVLYNESYNRYNNYVAIDTTGSEYVISVFDEGFLSYKSFPNVVTKDLSKALSSKDRYHLRTQLASITVFEEEKFDESLNVKIISDIITDRSEWKRKDAKKAVFSKPVFTVNKEYCFFYSKLNPNKDAYLYIYERNETSWKKIAKYYIGPSNK